MGFRYIPAQFQIVSVKLNKPADKASIAALESTWKGIDRIMTFNTHYLKMNLQAYMVGKIICQFYCSLLWLQ